MKIRIQILFAVVVLIVAGWTGAWFFGAGYVKTQVKSLAEADGVTTPKLDCGELSVGGFPFRFDAICKKADLTLGDLDVSVPEIVATVLVYRPTHALVAAKSPAEVSDAFSGAQQELSWQQAEASVRLSGWRLERFSVQLKQPVLSDTLVGKTTLASASLAEFHLLDAPDLANKAKHLAGLAYFERLNDLEAPGLGVAKGKLTTEGTITGVPDDVRNWAGQRMALAMQAAGSAAPGQGSGAPDFGLLRAFQAAGGVVTVKSLAYTDAKSSLSASGQANLAPNGRVNGAATVTSKGVVETFKDALPEALRGSLIGKQQADGSYTQNIQIANGVMLVGLVPVAVLPPLF